MRPTATGLDLSWTPSSGQFSNGVFLYNIYYWDLDTDCAFLISGAFQGTSAHIDGLNPQHRYLTAIEAWNGVGAGFPKGMGNIAVGLGTPGVPQNLKTHSNDGTTVILTWDAVPGAGGYNIWRRSVNDANTQLQKLDNAVSEPCAGIAFQFPGTWTFE